jgi:hypothetical protein
VSFHTCKLPEDCWVRLLVKKLGRGMPENVVREELESLKFVSRELYSCDPAAVIRIPPRTALPLHTSYYLSRVDLRCQRCAHSPNSAVCECRFSRT